MSRLFVLLQCSILISWSVGSQKCTTPDKKPGSCVNIKYCSSLVSLPKSWRGQLFLRLSECTDNNYSTYCCPDDDYDEIILPAERPKKFASRFQLDYEPCTTHNGEPGRCVLLENCRSLIELLKQGTYTVAKEHYLQERECGFEGSKVKVCCSADLPEERKNLQDNPVENIARSIPIPNPRNLDADNKNYLTLQDNVGLGMIRESK